MVDGRRPFPWYDDRVTTLGDGKSPMDFPWEKSGAPDCAAPLAGDIKREPAAMEKGDAPFSWSPRQIYEYLDQKVWKQGAAKQTAAVLTYNILCRGIRENAFFVGPTGCGKTYIWQCLQTLYPDRIVIVDASRITQEGWKGSFKWTDMLKDPRLRTSESTILVMDEADKFLLPRHTSQGENVAQTTTGEGLKILEGSQVSVQLGRETALIDTSRISFICCGAFAVKADQIAQSQSWKKIGFGDFTPPVQVYDRPLTEKDLLDCGVLPEFLGRIQQIVNLEPMTSDDFFDMLDSPSSPVSRIEKKYKVKIRLSQAKRRELADLALSTGLGIRGVENQLRQLLDNAIFEDHTRTSFEF